MGVSAGAGMIHYVLLTRDDLGRSVVDSRVIDVDPTDGLDGPGRVNAGIDVMLSAAREADARVGPIGVAARTTAQRRHLRSRGSGPRRQIRLVAEDEAVVAYLADTGEIDRFSAAVVVDCGDTGMTMYTVDPQNRQITAVERSTVISGRRLDRAIAEGLTADNPALGDSSRTRAGRSELLSACRTAKEEIAYGGAGSGGTEGSPVTLPGGSGRVSLTESHVAGAVEPMVREAREVFDRYVADVAARGINPDAVVFVGGLANLPAVREITQGHDFDTVCPSAPELVAATGAALLAGESGPSTARLAFIGGRPQREWLSAMPLAVAGAIIAAALITIYAVSSSFAERQVTEPSPSVDSVPAVATTSEQRSDPVPTTSAPVTRVPDQPVEQTFEQTFEQPTVPQQPVPTPDRDAPGWATTELAPTSPSTGTSTRTLSPYPWPTLPFAPGTTPRIPPDLLPKELLPSSPAPTPPPPDHSATPRAEAPAAPSSSSPVPVPR
ncbi:MULTISPECIES: hypothetical protein [Gordonia]|uniref:hypothetical protein n=1 Tax=Gordonia TaxID=2053 RepID=UPI0002A635E5|nr:MULTISPECIES: hypothetical protein [Gordonia]ATD72960.1 hypothetical protein CNO18_08340 [Gordonia sp. 1D]MBA5846706.1 hypothetical protein [Gordonia amicalis]MDV7101848.1 hypothetical protein [Gordonia amicalis]MDV7173365.1 hypothetical protein [Gordonia amicalis]NKX76475.1 hypothetical protein [Gordonia amicalis]